MPYTLWSRGRLVGHTDLDVRTITPTMRQGFIEPTLEGMPVLADATSVWRAIAEQKRSARARGETRDGDHLLVLAAMERRQGLELEMRDENGKTLENCFIRITDLADMRNGLADEMDDTEEEREAKFQEYLSTLSPEAQEKALAKRAEEMAEIEDFVEEMFEEEEEAELLGEGWPPPPPDDERWDTMQYLIQLSFLHEAPGGSEMDAVGVP